MNAYSIDESPSFREAEKRWLPYARLVRNVPSRDDRSLLLHLSGLEWIDSDKRETLFEDEFENLSSLFQEKEDYFAKRKRFTHVSEILRQDLEATANNIGHKGSKKISEQAARLWESREKFLQEKLQDLDKSLTVVQERLHVIRAKYAQVSVLIKRFRRNGTPIPNEPDPDLVKGKNGLYIVLLAILSAGAAVAGLSFEMPVNALSYVASGLSAIFVLTLLPSWKLQAAAKHSHKRSKIKDSLEYLKRENNDLIRRMQENQAAYDDLQREISITKEELEYNYV